MDDLKPSANGRREAELKFLEIENTKGFHEKVF